MDRSSNPFERMGRLNKTTRLVRALDRQLVEAGLDPMMPGLGDALAEWTPENWARLAVVNGIKPPSPVSIGMVLNHYRERNDIRRSA